jgi:hypothetical protein
MRFPIWAVVRVVLLWTAMFAVFVWLRFFLLPGVKPFSDDRFVYVKKGEKFYPIQYEEEYRRATFLMVAGSSLMWLFGAGFLVQGVWVIDWQRRRIAELESAVDTKARTDGN